MDNNLILKRFFSKKVFEDLLSGKKNEVFDLVVKRYISDSSGMSYCDIVSEIYCYLANNYRTEYYYKNTLLNKLLLKKHNYKKTIVLTELPVADSKADFVMINGRGVVYEIKTELDNLERLESQVKDYYKAFKYVYIVTYEKNIEKVMGVVDEKVGIILITKRGAIKTYREAEEVDEFLTHECIFKMLRKYEFESIIKRQGFKLPDVPRVNYYSECLKLFDTIDLDSILNGFLIVLKQRKKSPNKLYKKVPYELKMMVYQLDYDDDDYKHLFSFLNSHNKEVGDNNVFSLS